MEEASRVVSSHMTAHELRQPIQMAAASCCAPVLPMQSVSVREIFLSQCSTLIRILNTLMLMSFGSQLKVKDVGGV